MRNLTRRFGVYSSMRGLPLLLICSLAAGAQTPPERDPLDAAIEAMWQARSEGRFQDAGAAREQARTLLARMRPEAPQYADRVQQVAQSYQMSGMNGQARAILQAALSPAAALGNAGPGNAALLGMLGDLWWQDGSLLKAVGYLEQAAALQAEAPPAGQGRFVVIAHGARYSDSRVSGYMRLADLYRQLGRPDAVAGVAARIRTLAPDATLLAEFYERNGQLDDAAAIYRKLAGESADPQASSNAWQQLADLEARQDRFTDAVSSLEQAISAARSSGKPDLESQALWMRQNMAEYLRRAGLTDRADQIYRQLLQDIHGGPQEISVLSVYSRFLGETQRVAQGQSLLQDYLAGNSSLDPQQKAAMLYSLANLASQAGDSKNAEEYQRLAHGLQAQTDSLPAGQIRLVADVQKAQAAVNQRHLDDAFTLAIHILDMAPQAVDREQVEWFVPLVAAALNGAKQPAKADQLFQRLFGLLETWKTDNLEPLISGTRNYVRFLMSQPDRASEVPAAIERYRSLLGEANGSESGRLAEPVRLKVEWERDGEHWDKAEDSAREVLRLQESLSGNTSEPYLYDLQMAAGVFRAAGDSAAAVPLLRQAVAIADRVNTSDKDWHRSQTRMDLAFALAGLDQFEEAEALAQEAVAVDGTTPHPRPPLVQQLEQIRQMKRAAAKN